MAYRTARRRRSFRGGYRKLRARYSAYRQSPRRRRRRVKKKDGIFGLGILGIF